MPTLTQEQLQIVGARRIQSPPAYWNWQTQSRSTISDDTEAALILLPSEAKTALSTYLQTILELNRGSPAWIELLEEYYNAQRTNAVQAIGELEIFLADYTAIKESVVGSGEDTFVVGLEPVMKAVSLGLKGMKRKQHDANYHNLYLNAGAARQEVSRLTHDQKKTLRSWMTIIATYP